jgi:hypothetical protein
VITSVEILGLEKFARRIAGISSSPYDVCLSLFFNLFSVSSAREEVESRNHGGSRESSTQDDQDEEAAYWRTESKSLCICDTRAAAKDGSAFA